MSAAERDVHPWAGEVIGCDSASAVYKAALDIRKADLDARGIDVSKVHADAYGPILKSLPRLGEKKEGSGLTFDAKLGGGTNDELAALAKEFPDAMRLRQGVNA